MTNYLIKNAKVVDPANGIDTVCDVAVENGKISAVGKDLKVKGAEIIDATDLVCMPGLVDIHVHLREPGYEGKETILTGTQSALKGGFTTVCMMPNTDPVMDNVEHLKLAQKIIDETAQVNVKIIGSITMGRKGEQLTDFASLKKAGAVAVSDDGSSVADAAVMQEAFKESIAEDLPIISHAEDLKLVNGGVMNEGFISNKLGLKPISNASEYEMIRRDAQLAKGLDARIHIAHVSTKESCEIIAAAKARGVAITAEVTPHHLTLTDKECESFSGNTKMNPPLRSAEDVEAVKQALIDGVIDVVASDHAPHAVHEKEVEFDLAMFGIIGLETSFPLCYETLVKSGKMPLTQLVEVMSLKPSKLLGLNKGTLSVGADADIILVNPEAQWVYTKEEILSASYNTPYIGRTLTGKVEYTFVNGKLKYKNGLVDA
ncbi:dihydroorotase [Elusimicrobium posterum]|uniref:dihydroorotase n=1 Tax=Elusimicrobium posterum TaxID=3116653 RepID=UPI003C780198